MECPLSHSVTMSVPHQMVDKRECGMVRHRATVFTVCVGIECGLFQMFTGCAKHTCRLVTIHTCLHN